jgi:hypothetical protein
MALLKNMHSSTFYLSKVIIVIQTCPATTISAKNIIMKTRAISLQALTLFAIATGF